MLWPQSIFRLIGSLTFFLNSKVSIDVIMVLVYKLERRFNKRHKELYYYTVDYSHKNLKMVCCLAFIDFK